MILTVMTVGTEMTVFLPSLSFLQCSDDKVKMSFTSRTRRGYSDSIPIIFIVLSKYKHFSNSNYVSEVF